MAQAGKVRLPRSLTVRLLLMLSLALVPLGSFAVFQNDRARSEARRSEETSLLSMTFASVAGELALIRGAIGSADALGGTALSNIENPEECAQILEDFVTQAGLFRFAGFADLSGEIVCSSQEPPWSFAQVDLFEALRAAEGPIIIPGPSSGADNRSPLVVASPVSQNDAAEGFVILVLASFALDFVREYGQRNEPTATIFFASDGRRISSQPRDLDLGLVLPEGQDLASFVPSTDRVLALQNAAGEPRTYATMSFFGEQLVVLGVWAPEDLPMQDPPPASSTLGFALLVWLVSLGVAYFGAHRLVVRHLRTLGRQMRRFGDGKRDEMPRVLHEAPDEISELSRAFSDLARNLAEDEAQLEASLSEKTLLLREINHRVRNNLQLIASIISIQSRQVGSDGARALLGGLHDRVMTLARVHQSLYKLDRVSELRADTLLGDIIRQMLSISAVPGSNIEVGTDLQPVTLDADKIVPLALLATEAVTNALKYVAPPRDGPARIDIRLHAETDQVARLEVINTCAPGIVDADADAEAKDRGQGGIGRYLIRAFAAQLEGQPEQGMVDTATGPSFRVGLRFGIGSVDADEDARPA